jgi:YbbR domain-containing protein
MAYPGFPHIGLKLLSILLASLIWLVVSGEQIVERALRIPLEFTNLPADLELIGDTPDLVDVRVRGSSGALSRVAAGELIAVLDLRGARPGRRLFHLTGADVRAPFGIEVVQLAPSNVSIVFEPSATKVVPVVPELDGEPLDGYVVNTVSAEPSAVEVIGPASAVTQLTEAMTEPVSVTEAASTIVEEVNMGVADPSIRLVSPGSAKVTVHIGPAPAEWAITGIGVRAKTEGVQIFPSTVTVFVRGPRELRASRAEDYEATIDTEGLQPSTYQLPVRITPPPRVGVVSVEPPIVRVLVR